MIPNCYACDTTIINNPWYTCWIPFSVWHRSFNLNICLFRLMNTDFHYAVALYKNSSRILDTEAVYLFMLGFIVETPQKTKHAFLLWNWKNKKSHVFACQSDFQNSDAHAVPGFNLPCLQKTSVWTYITSWLVKMSQFSVKVLPQNIISFTAFLGRF